MSCWRCRAARRLQHVRIRQRLRGRFTVGPVERAGLVVDRVGEVLRASAASSCLDAHPASSPTPAAIANPHGPAITPVTADTERPSTPNERPAASLRSSIAAIIFVQVGERRHRLAPHLRELHHVPSIAPTASPSPSAPSRSESDSFHCDG